VLGQKIRSRGGGLGCDCPEIVKMVREKFIKVMVLPSGSLENCTWISTHKSATGLIEKRFEAHLCY